MATSEKSAGKSYSHGKGGSNQGPQGKLDI
jgi:hypothetical protein